MSEIAIGSARYVIAAAQRSGRWTASATRAGTGDRFGIECTGASEAEACGRLERWLIWQSEHAAALDSLQRAEQAYHRVLAGSAFSTTAEGLSATELQRDSLEQVEATRIQLDAVRARRPN
jgi:hypothetical protein